MAPTFTGFRTADELPSLKRYITLQFLASGSRGTPWELVVSGNAMGRPKKSVGGWEKTFC